jgi:hypothetical protein
MKADVEPRSRFKCCIEAQRCTQIDREILLKDTT